MYCTCWNVQGLNIYYMRSVRFPFSYTCQLSSLEMKSEPGKQKRCGVWHWTLCIFRHTERKLIIYLMFNTQSTTKVVAGQHTVHCIVSKKCDWVLQHILQYAWRGFGEEEKNEVKVMGKQKFNKAEFLAAGRAFKAILWPAPDVTDRAFGNFSFSAEGP